MPPLSFLRLVAVLALLVPAHPAWAQAPAEDPALLGPWAVGFQAFDLVDPAREDRTLPTALWYPVAAADAVGEPAFYSFRFFEFGLESEVALVDAPAAANPGGFALVVFSHGSGSLNIQSAGLMEALASHGFVVVSPNHTGNTFTEAFTDTQDPFEVIAIDRPTDVSFVIDEMLARNAAAAGPLFGRIDPQRIGVAGHSFGGYTSIAMAAGVEGVPPDRRVRAIAPIAPASSLFSLQSLARISVPMLILGGTLDDTTPIDPNSTRPFAVPFARRKYRVDITGATHTSFANVCEIGQVLSDLGSEDNLIGQTVPGWTETCSAAAAIPFGEVQRIQSVYVISFFRRWLRGEIGYNHFLDPAYAAANEPAVTYFLTNNGCGSGLEFAGVAPALAIWRRRRRRA